MTLGAWNPGEGGRHGQGVYDEYEVALHGRRRQAD